MTTFTPVKKFQHFLKIGQFCADFGKKAFVKNAYSRSSQYYTAVLNQYVNFGNYLNILEKTTHLYTVNTDTIIQPEILGVDMRNVVAKNGKPDFIFSENNLTIYLYKWKFNGLKTRCEIHFYDQTAFFVNYNYSILNNASKNFVIKKLAEKYLAEEVQDINVYNSKLIDKNNNTLFIDDTLDFKVTYFSNKEAGWLLNLVGEMDAKEKKKNIKIRLAEKQFYNKI